MDELPERLKEVLAETPSVKLAELMGNGISEQLKTAETAVPFMVKEWAARQADIGERIAKVVSAASYSVDVSEMEELSRESARLEGKRLRATIQTADELVRLNERTEVLTAEVSGLKESATRSEAIGQQTLRQNRLIIALAGVTAARARGGRRRASSRSGVRSAA
jgi:hypothetical protein